jgi:hypothetical protein
MLREADYQLRTSQSMTVNRVLGTHTNRWRPDKNVIEIGNLSPGGDHPDKMAAAEEVVIKSIIALQEYYDDPDAAENYDEKWKGIVPTPEERDDIFARQRVVDVARANTMLFSLFGKDRNMFDSDWKERTPREIFDAFATFVDQYAPEPLSGTTLREIKATLKTPPVYENDSLRSLPRNPTQFKRWTMGAIAKVLRYSHVREHSINDPLARFFEKGSHMTATEALRLAEPLDNLDPPITLNQLMLRFATYSYRKRMERSEAKAREEAETRQHEQQADSAAAYEVLASE